MSTTPRPESAARSAWILLAITFAIACIPLVGFMTWLIAGPVLFVCFILSIVTLSRGSTGQGIILLIFTLIGAPAAILIIPFLGLGAGAALASPLVPKPTPQAISAMQVPTGPAADAAKARAVRRFPQLGIAGSPLNTAFLRAVEKARVERPELFSNPEWPMYLASELQSAPTPVPAAQKGAWMWREQSTPLATTPVPSAAQRPVRYTWSQLRDGTWIEHDDRFTAMESIGGNHRKVSISDLKAWSDELDRRDPSRVAQRAREQR